MPSTHQLATWSVRDHRSGAFVQRRIAELSIPLHLLISRPEIVYLACLTAMLFRPPDLQFFCIDRIALGVLLIVTFLRVLTLRLPLMVCGPVVWPLVGLLILSVVDLTLHPFKPDAWSVLAAKWAVPLVLFVVAGLVFENTSALRQLDVFCVVILGYLVLIAVLFLFNQKQLIFPAFIVDDNIGIHSDRARGPFLQAVANGLALNMLGILAIDQFRRRVLPFLLTALLLIGLPLAILATKTRGVWLSFAVSLAMLLIFSRDSRVRKACLSLALIIVAGLAVSLATTDRASSFNDRLQERSPVAFRMAVYQAGWEMFLRKPVSGWGFDGMQTELTRRVTEFHQREYFFHNTFLEIAVQHGTIGLTLYIWLTIGLFRLARPRARADCSSIGTFMDAGVRSLWPVLLIAYFLNACLVVMNYQFVNGLLFTVAGILAAQNRRGQNTYAHSN